MYTTYRSPWFYSDTRKTFGSSPILGLQQSNYIFHNLFGAVSQHHFFQVDIAFVGQYYVCDECVGRFCRSKEVPFHFLRPRSNKYNIASVVHLKIVA